jgi:hypothetical protein
MRNTSQIKTYMLPLPKEQAEWVGESVCKLDKYTWRPTDCDMEDEYYKQKYIIMILLPTKGLIKG